MGKKGYKIFMGDGNTMVKWAGKLEEKEWYHTDNVYEGFSGFHFCLIPSDCLIEAEPFPFWTCRRIEADGKIDTSGKTTAYSCTDMKIGEEITLTEFIDDSIRLADIVENREVVKPKMWFDAISEKIRGIAISENLSAITTGYNGTSISPRTAISLGKRSVAITNKDYGISLSPDKRSVGISSKNHSISVSGEYGRSETYGVNSMSISNKSCGRSLCFGERGIAISSGDNSRAISEGKDSITLVTGYGALAETKSGIAIAYGYLSAASGGLGSTLILTEWENNGEEDEPLPEDISLKEMRTVIVDGKNIMPNKFYRLANGQVVEDKAEMEYCTKSSMDRLRDIDRKNNTLSLDFLSNWTKRAHANRLFREEFKNREHIKP